LRGVVTRDEIIELAKTTKNESSEIDFKKRFDVKSAQDWCEMLKDVVAMANSGGGCVLIGVEDDGTPSMEDISAFLELDPAVLTDKIAKYTGVQFSDFELTSINRDENEIALLLIRGVSIPMVFVKPGTYDIGGGRQKTAFGQGSVYFRHGAKSEPGNSDDLRKSIEHEIARIRKDWLGNIKKVVTAPIGHKVQILPPEVTESSSPTATPIRIVDDENVPSYKLETPDDTHPYRQKDVIKKVNERLRGRKIINTYDILCVRRVHEIDKLKPQFYYRSKYGSPQYSTTFIDWLVDCYNDDTSFFDITREQHRQMKKII